MRRFLLAFFVLFCMTGPMASAAHAEGFWSSVSSWVGNTMTANGAEKAAAWSDWSSGLANAYANTGLPGSETMRGMAGRDAQRAIQARQDAQQASTAANNDAFQAGVSLVGGSRTPEQFAAAQAASAQSAVAMAMQILGSPDINSAYVAPFVKSFVSQASVLGKNFSSSLSSEILTLLNYAFLVWLLLQVAKMMLGMEAGGQVFWNIVRKSSIYVILAVLLGATSSASYWTWFVDEPTKIATALGTKVLTTAGGSSCGGLSGDAAGTAGALACSMENAIRGGIAVGYAMMAGFPWDIFATDKFHLMLTLGISGFFLMLLYALTLIFFGFYVLDVFFRVLVLAMFSPIFIGCYLFDGTRGITKSAISNLIGSFVTLVGACAVLGVNIQVMMSMNLGAGNWPSLIQSTAKAASEFNMALVGPATSEYWMMCFSAITLVATAKTISGMMSGVFGSSASGTTMADTAAGLASLPVKAGIALGTGGAGIIALGAGRAGMSAVSGAGRGAIAAGKGAFGKGG